LENLPETVRVTLPGHHLFGEELAVHGWHHLGDEIHLLVGLPDGSRGYFPARWTAIWPPSAEAEPALTLLTSEAVRELRFLVRGLQRRRKGRPRSREQSK
jgi:hypothetical protein